ncbi:MAG TPA: C69 family dipeptidase [Anaerolineales bacterium]|nr:C69 family dipeptidase [Anaerolineales bacterium]
MCDTLVALGGVTADGVTLFGKNSDREPNEGHHVVRIPAAHHAAGSKVKCTHIEMPQVSHTFAVLLAKPFWIWGAEMGANEHGVTIGNEAVFTKVGYEKGPGLIGMDFLRLALERARTAGEALHVITQMLEQYGQGGNCGFAHKTYYHNSFLIADPDSAWVLETAGREWAAERVRDVRTISNGITIGSRWDEASPNLVKLAVDRGWCKRSEQFHFGRCYSDPLYTSFSRCNDRQCRTTDALTAQRGRITVHTVMQALRDHGPQGSRPYTPDRGIRNFEVCAHPGFGPIRATGTTGSMVSHLAPDGATHFVTGTAAPCTSLFKPAWVDADVPGQAALPGGTYDQATLFWRHEALHRATLRDYATRLPLYAGEREALEQRFVDEALARRRESSRVHAEFVQACFADAARAEQAWLERVEALPRRAHAGWLYERAWTGFNREAHMPVR